MIDESTAFRPPEETPTVVAGDGKAPLQLTPGTVLGNRYRVVSLIGHGGMGAVYRADDLKLGQTVALKFLARHGDAQRLYEEVRIGRQVSHPNVCRLYDIAEVDGHLFITMEFVDGEDLASLLRRVGRLSAEKALAVTRDICAGVAAAHEKGVIHRDLKPANVMIDGRGRARVTDFGLAVASGGATDSAGTPAYMAPEQLSGESATVRSDVYALGLVIYEVFTGKRPFDSTSAHDLLARQQRRDYSRPSLVTKDVPAAIERVIAKCLEPDPQNRPASVEQIALELPGGDPLAAAIAAGETPSPAMVAAAADRGELSARAAWTVLGTAVVALLAYAALTPQTMLYRRAELKSPEVLRERVREVLDATKQNLAANDWSYVYAMDLQWAQRKEGSSAMPPIVFAYRQSPGSLTADNFEQRVFTNDPPLVLSGMADVTLDSSGRLRRFTIVPPQLDREPRPGAPVDWTPFIRFAGIAGPWTEARSEWSSLIDTDEKHAWVAPDGSRIEAASYHGRPVSFDVIKPYATPWRMLQRGTRGAVTTAGFLIVAVGFWVAAVLLAMRNLRRGQVDIRGARHLAIVTSAFGFVGGLLLAHHVNDVWDETINLFRMFSLALLVAGEAWVGYIAIEPLVRRRWPRMLISEMRAMRGQVRDAMVGRDVLVGLTAGIVVNLLRSLTALLPGSPPLQSANLALSGLRYVAWFLCGSTVLAILGAFVAATLLVAFQVFTRNLVVPLVVIMLLGVSVLVGDVDGPLWAQLTFGFLGSAVVLLLLFRFGFLAYGAGLFAYLFVRRIPITLDPADWFFGRSAFAIAIVLAIAVYGFVTSLGGKRWLPELAD